MHFIQIFLNQIAEILRPSRRARRDTRQHKAKTSQAVSQEVEPSHTVCICIYIAYQSDVALEVHVLTTNEGGDR